MRVPKVFHHLWPEDGKRQLVYWTALVCNLAILIWFGLIAAAAFLVLLFAVRSWDLEREMARRPPAEETLDKHDRFFEGDGSNQS